MTEYHGEKTQNNMHLCQGNVSYDIKYYILSNILGRRYEIFPLNSCSFVCIKYAKFGIRINPVGAIENSVHAWRKKKKQKYRIRASSRSNFSQLTKCMGADRIERAKRLGERESPSIGLRSKREADEIGSGGQEGKEEEDSDY